MIVLVICLQQSYFTVNIMFHSPISDDVVLVSCLDSMWFTFIYFHVLWFTKLKFDLDHVAVVFASSQLVNEEEPVQPSQESSGQDTPPPYSSVAAENAGL